MKKWRFVGFDDSFRIYGSISELKGSEAVVVGCVTAGTLPEGFMFDRIKIDGMDSTEKIVAMVKRSKFREQIKCIFLSGLTLGGFNTVNISRLNEETAIPVVVVMRRQPDFDAIKKALENVSEKEERWKAIEAAGEVFRVGKVYVQLKGCSAEDAESFLKLSTAESHVPEPLRLAHMVATAIVHGESRGKV
ncbi:MAG: DUF99 family protein [Archaeoglobus sp.]|nr:DUF99 family protein [Archaeoglobus sp.]